MLTRLILSPRCCKKWRLILALYRLTRLVELLVLVVCDLRTQEFCVMLLILTISQGIKLRKCIVFCDLREMFFILITKLLFDRVDGVHVSLFMIAFHHEISFKLNAGFALLLTSESIGVSHEFLGLTVWFSICTNQWQSSILMPCYLFISFTHNYSFNFNLILKDIKN